MSFKLPIKLLLGIFFFLLLLLPSQAEQTYETQYFNVKPEKCVALRQGRECLADVTFNWKVLQAGDYCLVDKLHQLTIYCWQNSVSGFYQFSFSSQQTLGFSLIEKLSKKVVMESKVEVSWVYKTKHKKRRWRLF